MPRVAACSICSELERMTDPDPTIPLIPAVLQWEDQGEIKSHEMTTDDGEVIMVPEYDPILEDFVARHTHDRPDTDALDYIKTFSVSQSTWERMDVVTKIKQELSEATGEQFAESEHYKEGALRCYNAHGNPDIKNRCPDVFSDDKRIGRKTPDARHQMYVCHMCPYVQSHVVSTLRGKAGLYDPEKAKRAISSKVSRDIRKRQRKKQTK